MTYSVKHFIDGRGQAAGWNYCQELYNPATGAVVGKVAFATKEEIEQALLSAKGAYSAWSHTSIAQRRQVLFKFKSLLEAHTDELAQLVTREHGKTLTEAKASIARGIELTEFWCGLGKLLQGTYSEHVSKAINCYTIRQPLGVCVGITPFNFPVMVALWMTIPAIACGNTFILKPSEKNPSVATRLAELLQEAGLPDGVFNVINGDKNAVNHLIKHPDVTAVSCVGSTAVAESIYQTAIAAGKRAHTFGGAKNHGVVMPDANLDQTVDLLVEAAFGSAGERCMALPALIAVGDEVADQLVKRITAKASELRLGAGDNEATTLGPLITEEHLKRVVDYVELGLNEGAQLVLDGRDCKVPGFEKGFFLGPCVFDQVTADMRIYREEIFGPVLVILRVNDFSQALQLVNSHEYANGTAIFTENGGIAREFASQVEVGMVGINVPIPVPVAYHSFGGWKRSVFGDITMHGDESVKFYTRPKSITERYWV